MLYRVMTAVSLILGLMSCSGGEKSSESSVEDQTGALEIDLSENPLAASYASGLSMNVLPTDTDDSSAKTTGSLQIDSLALQQSVEQKPLQLLAEDIAGNLQECKDSHLDDLRSKGVLSDFEKAPEFIPERVADAQVFSERRNKLLGKSEECFGKDLDDAFRLVEASPGGDPFEKVLCYEFDWGLEQGYPVDTNGDKKPGSDACLVQFTRAEFDAAKAYLDLANAVQSAMLCEAKKRGKAKELTENETLDLSAALREISARDSKGAKFSAGKISRRSDRDGKKVYETEILINTPCEQCGDEANDFLLKINHTPLNEQNSEYEGYLSIKADLPPAGPALLAATEKFRAVAVRYRMSKVGELDRLKMKVTTASMNADHFSGANDPYGVDGELELNAGSNEDGSFGEQNTPPPAVPANNQPSPGDNQYLENMKLIYIDGFPTEKVYDFAYWRNPGGSYNENARGFVFNTSRDKDGVRRGCGVAGASAATAVGSDSAYSIRKALAEGKALEPKGYLRPFKCTEGNEQKFGEKVWLQCFKQNSDGRYEVDLDFHGGDEFEFLPTSDDKIRALRAVSSF